MVDTEAHQRIGALMTGSQMLAKLIEEYYLNDSKLARLSGVHVNTIKALKADRNEPRPDTVRRIAAVFDKPSDAARLVEAFGFPGLMDDSHEARPEADVIAAVIAETEAALTKLRDVYAKIMQGRA